MTTRAYHTAKHTTTPRKAHFVQGDGPVHTEMMIMVMVMVMMVVVVMMMITTTMMMITTMWW